MFWVLIIKKKTSNLKGGKYWYYNWVKFIIILKGMGGRAGTRPHLLGRDGWGVTWVKSTPPRKSRCERGRGEVREGKEKEKEGKGREGKGRTLYVL